MIARVVLEHNPLKAIRLTTIYVWVEKWGAYSPASPEIRS